MSTDTIPAASNRSITKRILLASAAFLSVIVILIAGSVFFLPAIISTEWFRDFAETRVSETLHRPVQIKRVSWSWKGEIEIEGVLIKDLPVFSDEPICSISKAAIQLDLKKILQRRLIVNLTVSDITMEMIRNHNGQTNLEKFLFPLTRSAPAGPEQPPRSSENRLIKFPVDVQATGRFNNITLKIDDQQTGHRLALEKMNLQLAMPSLYFRPITIDISSDLKLQGHQIPSIRLNSKIKNLFNNSGKLDITHALFSVDALLPGSHFTINHDPGTKKTKARIKIHLPQLQKILFPFIPPSLAATKIRGDLEFLCNVDGNPMKTLSFDTQLTGNGIGMSGGVIPKKRLVPFDFSLSNRGIIELNNGTISIQNGSLQSLGDSQVSWSGTAGGLNQSKPMFDIVIGPVWINLEKLFAVVREFIPKDILFLFQIDSKAPILKIKTAHFSGSLPPGPNRMELSDFTLTIPGGIKYRLSRFFPSSFSAENLRFSIAHLKSTAEKKFPQTIDLSASIQVDELNIAGEKNIYINTLKIPQLRIKAEEIDRSKTSPFGFTSKLELQESIILNKLEIPGFITMKNAMQKLAATWTEKPETGIDLGLKTFHIAIPSLAIRNRLLTSFQTDSDFIAAANRIHIDHLNPFKANLSGLSIRWVLGKILKMGIEAEIKYLSTARLDTKGELAVDLEAFFNKFLKKSYHNNRLTGDAKFQWRFAGTIPTTEELKKLKEGSKFDIKNDFNFLDKLYFSSILNDVGLDWTVTDERKIKIGRVSTRKPVKYRFDKISGIGRASGNLLIENIDTGPIEIFKLPLKGDPLSIHLSFSGKHRYLKTFSFSQVLDLLPFKIKETLNISLYGLDRISKEDLASPLPAFLEHIGGNASSTLSFQGGNSLNTLTGDLNIEGKVMAGSKVQLTPGQRIDIKSWIDTPKMNVDIGSNFAIKNLQADLNLNKRFYISDQETKNKTKTSSLSVDVLKKRPLPFGSELKDVTLQRRMNRLQKRFKPKHSISFKSARIGGQPNPILIDRSVMDLDLSEALPKVDFFQSDLLGGTVIGSVLILDENPGFLLQTQMSFSGLNAKNLLSLKRGENEDRSISGELFLSFPLTEQSRQLLQELNLSLKFSHIGSRSLEGFLYMIDPSESNETISSQRRLLQIGTPTWIELTIKNGILSLYGEVKVKGISIKIPSLERLNIGNLPGLANIEEQLTGLGQIIKLLDIYTKNSLKIGNLKKN